MWTHTCFPFTYLHLQYQGLADNVCLWFKSNKMSDLSDNLYIITLKVKGLNIPI